MGLNVGKELAALKGMTASELRDKYALVFGEEPRTRHKQFLVKRIIWRLQATEQGDLTERARRRAAELANDADIRMVAPTERPAEPSGQTVVGALAPPADGRLPMPGAVITRDYKGQSIRVMVLDNGFEYGGRVYRSLSAIAKAVTGTHWNGYHFFGLNKDGAK